MDGKDWYCFECHLAGDVISCANCFRVYHSDCITAAKRKFDVQKKANNYPKLVGEYANSTMVVENGEPVTIICDDSDDVILTTKSDDMGLGVASSSKKESELLDKSKLEFDNSLCSVCNINRIDYNCGLDKTEMNYILRFVLHRIRAWVSILSPNIICNLHICVLTWKCCIGILTTNLETYRLHIFN